MRFTRLAFMNRFTNAELETIYSAAKVNVAVEVWLAKFNAATADVDGTSVDTEDLRTIAGLQALETAGLLASGRANEILSGVGVSVTGQALGQFRVRAPFNEAFPLIYSVLEVVTGDDGSVTYILDQGAGGFDASNLEAA